MEDLWRSILLGELFNVRKLKHLVTSCNHIRCRQEGTAWLGNSILSKGASIAVKIKIGDGLDDGEVFLFI